MLFRGTDDALARGLADADVTVKRRWLMLMRPAPGPPHGGRPMLMMPSRRGDRVMLRFSLRDGSHLQQRKGGSSELHQTESSANSEGQGLPEGCFVRDVTESLREQETRSIPAESANGKFQFSLGKQCPFVLFTLGSAY